MYDSLDRLEDEELIKLCKMDNEDAINVILKRYEGMMSRMVKSMFLAGGDKDDLMQEARISLYNAIYSYNEEKHVSFIAFAKSCIDKRLCSAIRNANRKKHSPLNEAISFYSDDYGLDTDIEYSLIDKILDELPKNPETIVIDRLSEMELIKNLKSTLSEFEIQVLDYYLDGNNYKYIANILGKSDKSIDNTIQRIKKKLLKII